MKRILSVLLLLGIMILAVAGLTSAAISDLGTFKQNTNIRLIQICESCSYNNITSILAPDSTVIFSNLEMTADGSEYDYTLISNFTFHIGEYTVNGIGDLGGTDTTWNYKFEVTPSGFNNTLGLYFIFLIVLIAIIILGFSIKEVWFVVIGGLGLIMLGVYSINSGIVGFRDMFMTWGVGLFQISVGAILAIGAAWQKIDFD